MSYGRMDSITHTVRAYHVVPYIWPDNEQILRAADINAPVIDIYRAFLSANIAFPRLMFLIKVLRVHLLSIRPIYNLSPFFGIAIEEPY